MRISHSYTFVLSPLFYAFFAQTALLPATVSIPNGSLLGLPVISVPEPIPVADVPLVGLSVRSIFLAMLKKGRAIPEMEVKATLIDADQAIADLARDEPNQRIANDRFEYRRPNGNMLISIGTYTGEMITWKELARILQGLYRYMTGGLGAEGTHYQTLEFEMEAKGQKKPQIGLGVVWYFGPKGNQIQKRATLPFPYFTIEPSSNETTPRLPNTTLMLPWVEDLHRAINFTIPKTSLNLSFDYLGPSIPAQSVKATLQGAMANVRPFLRPETENHRIKDDCFRWILPLGREASVPVAVTVFTYHGCLISWRQLFDVLYGLFAFTTTFGTDLQETHYEVLAFKIVDKITSKRLGVGNISFFTSETGQLVERVEAIGHGVSPRPQSVPRVSSLNLMPPNSIPYPIAHTDITLTFTFLGITPIPAAEIDTALDAARERIDPEVTRTPHAKIPDRYRDISMTTRISTNVILYQHKYITYGELDDILDGLHRFCSDDPAHDRMLVFEIDIAKDGRGRVAFGTFLYVPPDQSNLTLTSLQ